MDDTTVHKMYSHKIMTCKTANVTLFLVVPIVLSVPECAIFITTLCHSTCRTSGTRTLWPRHASLQLCHI